MKVRKVLRNKWFLKCHGCDCTRASWKKKGTLLSWSCTSRLVLERVSMKIKKKRIHLCQAKCWTLLNWSCTPGLLCWAFGNPQKQNDSLVKMAANAHVLLENDVGHFRARIAWPENLWQPWADLVLPGCYECWGGPGKNNDSLVKMAAKGSVLDSTWADLVLPGCY